MIQEDTFHLVTLLPFHLSSVSYYYLFIFAPCHGIQIEALILSANSKLTLEEVEDTFQFPLDGFQKQAVSHFLEGKSVLVCAPTGAGKTAIAEAAAVAVLARFALLFLIIPLHPSQLLLASSVAGGRVQTVCCMATCTF